MMAHLNLEKEMNFTPGGITSKVIHKTPKSHCTLMCMAKNTELDTHTSSKNAVILVLKGEGTFVLENEKIKMKAGVFISMPANAKHSLFASENLAFLLCLTE